MDNQERFKNIFKTGLKKEKSRIFVEFVSKFTNQFN